MARLGVKCMVICWVLCSQPVVVLAQFASFSSIEDQKLIERSLHAIYNMQVDSADFWIQKFGKRYPMHPAYSFLQCMHLYWQMVPVSSDNKLFNTYRQTLESTLTRAEELSKEPADKQESVFFLLSAHSSLTYVHMRAKDLSEGLYHARKTYHYIKMALELTQKNAEFYFPAGLYLYYAEQYPETHPWLKPMTPFFQEGNKKLAFQYLERGIQKAMFCKIECLYFLMHWYIKYEDEPLKAEPYAAQLHAKFPSNTFFSVRYAEIAYRLENYALAKQLISQILKSKHPFYSFCAEALLMIIQTEHLRYAQVKKSMASLIQKGATLPYETQDYLCYMYIHLGHLATKERLWDEANYWFLKISKEAEYNHFKKEANYFLSKQNQKRLKNSSNQ